MIEAAQLSARGMSGRFCHGPAIDMRAVWLDLDSKHRVGRLTLWVSGEAVLSVARSTNMLTTLKRSQATRRGLLRASALRTEPRARGIEPGADPAGSLIRTRTSLRFGINDEK